MLPPKDQPGMKPIKQSTPTDAHHAQQLSSALLQMDQLVQQGCAEMSSIAQLALAWLEIPEGCRQMEVVARALQSIRNSADALADYAGTEARAVGCGFDDPAELRRTEAAEAAAQAVARLFEGRTEGAMQAED
jgi:hypothetical protein